ncbi:MAG: redoxin family protein [Rhodothermales bacterium]
MKTLEAMQTRYAARILVWSLTALLAASHPVVAQPVLGIGGSAAGLNRPMMDAVSGARMDVVSAFGQGGTVVVFWGNQCVWSQRYEERLRQVIRQARQDGVAVVLVNANDPEAFPKENAEESRQVARRVGVDRYFLDTDGSLARSMGAQRIPHVFLFDTARQLMYAGGIDDSPGDAALVQKTYLLDALTSLRTGAAPDPSETQPFGCRIKL